MVRWRGKALEYGSQEWTWWGAVLPGIQDAGLVSVGRGGHCQSSGPGYGATKEKGSWGYVGKTPAELGKLAN